MGGAALMLYTLFSKESLAGMPPFQPRGHAYAVAAVACVVDPGGCWRDMHCGWLSCVPEAWMGSVELAWVRPPFPLHLYGPRMHFNSVPPLADEVVLHYAGMRAAACTVGNARIPSLCRSHR